MILVDWGNGAKGPIYPNAAANTRLVGRQIGLLLEKIQKAKKLSYDKVHCIGGYLDSSLEKRQQIVEKKDNMKTRNSICKISPSRT